MRSVFHRRLLSVAIGGFIAAFSIPAYAADPLLDALDLTRPDLSAVRAAVESGDTAAARKAFADYLRTRKPPVWEIRSDTVSRDHAVTDQAIADDALVHKLESTGYAWQFGDKIDWSLDPTTLPNSPVAPNSEWTWQLNRHTAWASLSRVYDTTHDLKYSRELCAQMHGWIDDNPPPAPGREKSYNTRWRPIEAGLRMSRAWPEIYVRLVHDSAALPDDALLDMVESMRQHAEYLEVTTSWGIRSNHITVENSGLYAVGVLFPEFKRAPDWRRDAAQRQLEQIGYQVYPDGVQKELAPGYHMFSLKNFVQILTLSELNHFTLPGDYKARLEKMFAALMWQMSPARTTPPFNDSGASDVLIQLNVGLHLFPEHADWQWFTTGAAAGSAPAETSHYFPWAGWAAMRSDWSKDARYLNIECGPFGTAHQHEDKLSFVLHAYGATLVTECGVFMYEKSPAREYCLSARGHNVITVDGLDQYRHAGPSRYFASSSPIDVAWQSTPRFDYAQGTYGTEEDERLGRGRAAGFVHTRRVLFVKPDYWIIIDTVQPPDHEEHLYQSAFHLRAADATLDPQTHVVRTNNPGPNIAILPVAGDSMNVHVVTAQKEPVYQGWEAYPSIFKLSPAPTPIFEQRCKGVAKFLYVFSPSKPGEPGPVTSVKEIQDPAATISADIQTANGKTTRAALLADGTVTLTQPDEPLIRISPAAN